MAQQEIIDFADIFKADKISFLKQFVLKRYPHIKVEFLKAGEEEEELMEESEFTKKTYFKALKVTKNLMQNLWTGRPVDVKSSRRIVYSLVDSISRDVMSLGSWP
jgi:hypothetical protein